MGPGSAKTRAFNLLVESSSQFSQSKNQTCRRRLSEEGNRENGSTLSLLAHVFTRSGSNLAARSRSQERPETAHCCLCPAATFDRICREVAGRPAPTRQGSLAEPGEGEGTAIAPAREPDQAQRLPGCRAPG